MTLLVSVFGVQNGDELAARVANMTHLPPGVKPDGWHSGMSVDEAAEAMSGAGSARFHGYHQIEPSALPDGCAYDVPYLVKFRSTVNPGARCWLTVNGEHVSETVEVFELSGIWRVESVS